MSEWRRCHLRSRPSLHGRSLSLAPITAALLGSSAFSEPCATLPATTDCARTHRWRSQTLAAAWGSSAVDSTPRRPHAARELVRASFQSPSHHTPLYRAHALLSAPSCEPRVADLRLLRLPARSPQALATHRRGSVQRTRPARVVGGAESTWRAISRRPHGVRLRGR